MSKATPGPWTYWAEQLEIHEGDDSTVICRIQPFIDTSESEANARLIAAAPDLLEACEDLLFDQGLQFDGYWDQNKMRAAVIKAGGRVK